MSEFRDSTIRVGSAFARETLQYLGQHDDMAREFAEGRDVSSERIVRFIAKGVTLSPHVDILEDRRRLRMILRLWAARLARRGHEYPDIDIDVPHRRPQSLRTKVEQEFPDGERSGSTDSVQHSHFSEPRKSPSVSIPVERLAEIERSIENLRSVFVVAHFVERPRGALEEAVEYNFERGVSYRFLVSQSTAADALEGYYLIFETLARIVARRIGTSPEISQAISIAPLGFEWGSYPYVFYEYSVPPEGVRVVGLRGDQRQEGLAESYTLVEAQDATMLLRAILAGSSSMAPVPYIVPTEADIRTDIIPISIRRAFNG